MESVELSEVDVAAGMDLKVRENLGDGDSSEGDEEPGYMDPKLWGSLQYYFPLEFMIFMRLPLREFFQLRLVCREWNRLAGDRAFLVEANPRPIPKPWFHLYRRGPEYQLHGLLTYTPWRKKWDYVCLGLHDELECMVANEGLIFSYKGQDRGVLRVFDIHSRIWYTLPELQPPGCHGGYPPVLALKVDTSSYPYEFQVIQAGGPESPDDGSPTHTYDSRTNAWRLSEPSNITDCGFMETCVQTSDAVYVWSECYTVHYYKMDKDRWYGLGVPEVLDDFGDTEFEHWLTGVGAWQENVYHFSQVLCGWYAIRWSDFIMYKLEVKEQEWEESDRMPSYLRDWLTGSSDSTPVHLEILTSYCDEWVLIYSYCWEAGSVNRYVLYNLETRAWEIPDIPEGVVQPYISDKDEETEICDAAGCCYFRKKPRDWASDARRKSSDTGDEQHEVQEKQPATLDEWNNFLDQL